VIARWQKCLTWIYAYLSWRFGPGCRNARRDKVNENAANPIMFTSKRVLRPNSLCSVEACALMVSYLITFPAESQIYRFGYCLFGCPEGLSGNQTLVRSAYTLLSDENR